MYFSDRNTRQSRKTDTGNAVSVPETLVELEIEDLCWFYTFENPVFTCTVHDFNGAILWRRDDLFVGLGGRPVGNDWSQYNITSNMTNSLVRQERLHVFGHIVNSSIERASTFRCENQGYSSQNVYLEIPGKSRKKQFSPNMLSYLNI